MKIKNPLEGTFIGYLLSTYAAKIRWKIRGVNAKNYRRVCRACGRTGQMHWSFKGCYRFCP
jgi:hypothetical protein